MGVNLSRPFRNGSRLQSRGSTFPSPSPSLLGGACLRFQGRVEDGALAGSPSSKPLSA